MNIIQWRRLLLLSVGLCFIWSQSSVAALPETLELEYEVRYGIFKLGSLSSRLKKQSDQYKVTNETHAEGVAAVLLGGTVRETCEFSIDNNVVTPTRYRIVREGKDTFDYSMSFNADKRRVSFNNGTNVILSEGYIVDNCSVTFAFILGGANAFKEKTLHIIGAKKVRRFENNQIEKQEVSTPLGKFDAVKIEQVRFDRPDRKLLVWLDPNRHNLPLKIVEQRKSRPDTTMLLKSVKGL